MPKYDDILDEIAAVPRSTTGGSRDISWITPAEVVGVARDQGGRLELFLTGTRLSPAFSTVRDSLAYHEWHRKSGVPLAANRLILPAFGYYNPVTAFICAELLRNGADQDIDKAFRVTEPIIELAIKRLQISQKALLGLTGELLMLNAMCHQADDHLVGSVAQSWDGWRRSTRDFHWDGTGVELKTTMKSTSSHMVQGIHQIEPTNEESGELAEDRLVLVSVGLESAEVNPNAISVPTLVQRIINRLEAAGNVSLVPEFLTRVSQYGSDSGFGYDHLTMSDDPPFTSPFTITFFRGFDMSDPAIEVLRHDDLLSHHHVEMRSVSFRINLPATIGHRNPVPGANQVARWILRT